MKLRCIVAQPIQVYAGQLLPEIVDAWGEYTIEDNPEGYAKALREHQQAVGTDYEAVRELVLEVPESVLTGLFEIPHAVVVPSSTSGTAWSVEDF